MGVNGLSALGEQPTARNGGLWWITACPLWRPKLAKLPFVQACCVGGCRSGSWKALEAGDFLRQTGEIAKRILARVDIRTGIDKIDFG